MRSPGLYGGSAPQLPGRLFVAGRYYYGAPTGGDTTAILVQDTEYAIRFDVGQTATFDRIGIETTTFTATTVIRLGIRLDTGNVQPGELVLDAGTVSGAANAYAEATISQVLNPGRYWLTATAQVAGPVTVRGRQLDQLIGQTTTATNNATSLSATGRSGALPQSFGATTVSTIGPKILVRAA